MTLDDSVHGMRLRVMQRAQAVGSVSAVCRELGISRTLFYRCGSGSNAMGPMGCTRGGSAPAAAGPCRCRPRSNGSC